MKNNNNFFCSWKIISLEIWKYQNLKDLEDYIWFWTFKEWHLRDIKIYKFDVVIGFYSWKVYCLSENLDVLSLSLWQALPAMDIKITSMSIVELVFCEFLRRHVLVVRPRDWYGGKWVSSLRPILSRSSRGTPWFVSALKYESPSMLELYERNRNTNDTLQSILSASYG